MVLRIFLVDGSTLKIFNGYPITVIHLFKSFNGFKHRVTSSGTKIIDLKYSIKITLKF